MAGRLANKVAVVTGAGSEVGIGKETAKAMAAEGASVVVNDIVKDPDGNWGADGVVNEIKAADGTAVANYDSVASMAGGANIIKTAIKNFGRIDILVNAARHFIMKPTVDFTEEDWDAAINVHLKGLFACTRAAIEEMLKQKSGGRIINITSMAAYAPNTGTVPSIAYCTANAAVLGPTRSLSLTLKEYGITVNAISPGDTTEPFLKEGFVTEATSMMGPDYATPIIVFLAMDEAKDITGQIIYTSGGDITIYAPPMQVPGAHQYLHKAGKWTVDELIEIMPKMVEAGLYP